MVLNYIKGGGCITVFLRNFQEKNARNKNIATGVSKGLKRK
jgi:hypothetical protein